MKKVLICLLYAIALPLFLQSQDNKAVADSLAAEIQGAAVNPFRVTLFHIKAHLGPFSAQSRAERLSEKIRELAGILFLTKTP